MWKTNKHHIEDEKLDRFGEELLNALETSETEVNTAATSPFLYRRIRVRIEAEQKRLTEERGKWFSLLIEAKHAIPVLATIAMIAIGLLWYSPARVSQGPGSSNGTSTSSQMMMIGGLPVLSSDEMIVSIVGWNEGNSSQSKEQ